MRKGQWIFFLALISFDAAASVTNVPAGTTVADGSIGAGDRQNVYGTANNFEIGGVQDIGAGGTANGSQIISGGGQYISAGGAAYDTVIRGGELVVHGGTAYDTILYDGFVNLDSGLIENLSLYGGGVMILPGAVSDILTAGGGVIALYEGGRMQGDVSLTNAALTVVGDNQFDRLSLDNAEVTFNSFGGAPIQVDIAELQGNGRFNIRTNFGSGNNDILNVSKGSGNFGLVVADYSSESEFPDQIDLLSRTADNTENFYLVGGAMDIGAFQYTLLEDAGRWYLQRTYDYTDTSVIAKDTYATLSSIFYTHLDNIHARLSETRMTPKSGLWVRSLGREIKFDLGEGSKVDVDVYGGQFGADYVVPLGGLSRLKIGAGGGYTDASQKYVRFGRGDGETYSFSVYATAVSQQNFYLDLVASYYRHKQKIRSHVPSGLPVDSKYDLDAYSLSAEIGRRFLLNNGYFIEPQLQMFFMDIDDVDYRTSFNTPVRGKKQTSAVGRAGFAFGKNWNDKAEIYATASLLREFSGKSKITVSDWTFTENISETSFRLGAGMNVHLSEHAEGFANIATMFGNKSVRIPVEGSLGLKISF